MPKPFNSAKITKHLTHLNTTQVKRKPKSLAKEHISKHFAPRPSPQIKDDLTRMAIEEIQKDVAKGAVRATLEGPSGWRPIPRLTKDNKRLLKNTLRSVVAHNRRQNDPSCGVRQKSVPELDAILAGGQRRTPKFGERKHCFRKCVKKESAKNNE